jgi:putative flippase GtrA
MRLFYNLIYKGYSNQIVRFAVVGAVNTGFSLAIYSGLLFVNISYQIANLVALIVGIVFSFKTQGHLVFYNTDSRRLWRFILGWAVIYLGSVTTIGQIIAFGYDPYIAGVFSVPVSVAMSYLIQKYFVFRQSRN